MQTSALPSYKVFFKDVLGTLHKSWQNLENENKSLNGWSSTLRQYFFVTAKEFCLFLLLSIAWTVLRYAITSTVLKPIVKNLNLPRNEAGKMPESVWKLMFYTVTWSYSVYLLFFTKYPFFHDAPSTFRGWSVGMDVPTDIFIAYIVQLSFYLHSIYGTLYMDVWRKDSVMMLFHHLVTILLVGFSYAFRFVNIGMLILFCHDVTDIILEFTKIVLYLKKLGGRWYSICDVLSTIGFLMFGASWYLFRLYWFPLKAMYAAGHTSMTSIDGGPPFYFFFNTLLWILFGMNIYWFSFIVLMAYKVVTGQAEEVEDVRDYEEAKVKPHKNGVVKKKRN